METEDLCPICLNGLFMQPLREDIDYIMSCKKYIGVQSCNDILENSHKEIGVTACGHSFHTSCFLEYIKTNNERKCPMCRSAIDALCCFSRSAKNKDVYLREGLIDGPYHIRILRSRSMFSFFGGGVGVGDGT